MRSVFHAYFFSTDATSFLFVDEKILMRGLLPSAARSRFAPVRIYFFKKIRQLNFTQDLMPGGITRSYFIACMRRSLKPPMRRVFSLYFFSEQQCNEWGNQSEAKVCLSRGKMWSRLLQAPCSAAVNAVVASLLATRCFNKRSPSSISPPYILHHASGLPPQPQTALTMLLFVR